MKTGNFIERSLEGALSFLREAIFSQEYAAKSGFLQARDVRIRLLATIFLLLAVLFLKSISFLIGVYILCLLLAGVSSIKISFFFKRTWFFIPFFSLFIALPALFAIFTPGEPIFSFRVFAVSVQVTRQGLLSAGLFFMRVLSSVSLGILLVLTTRHQELLKALRIFKVPQLFVMTLGMCYRYIYLFIEILQNTYLAIKSRVGFVSSVKKGQGIVAWNIASLWKRSYLMHEQVYMAMLSRGYTGEPKVLEESGVSLKDILFLASAASLFTASLWQRYYLN
ncbi:MAG TPA: cobalt ECF transporter T component CbiQ [Candidatus Margulisiibacteriota bacterium]|nr:cobalt ECF transporter T component CbiQ [Candidatus Margulisiibacteriota bacterium]